MNESEKNDAILEKITNLHTLIDERDRRYEDRFKAIDEKTGLALSTSKEAVNKSETATEKRFDSVNEFRGQLKDQAATLIPRSEADVKFAALDKEMKDLKDTQIAITTALATSQGRSSGFSASWAIAVSLVFAGLTFIGLLLRAKQ
jgi:hypothetical protein